MQLDLSQCLSLRKPIWCASNLTCHRFLLVAKIIYQFETFNIIRLLSEILHQLRYCIHHKKQKDDLPSSISTGAGFLLSFLLGVHTEVCIATASQEFASIGAVSNQPQGLACSNIHQNNEHALNQRLKYWRTANGSAIQCSPTNRWKWASSQIVWDKLFLNPSTLSQTQF